MSHHDIMSPNFQNRTIQILIAADIREITCQFGRQNPRVPHKMLIHGISANLQHHIPICDIISQRRSSTFPNFTMDVTFQTIRSTNSGNDSRNGNKNHGLIQKYCSNERFKQLRPHVFRFRRLSTSTAAWRRRSGLFTDLLGTIRTFANSMYFSL
jgi:hypothetical protein